MAVMQTMCTYFVLQRKANLYKKTFPGERDVQYSIEEEARVIENILINLKAVFKFAKNWLQGRAILPRKWLLNRLQKYE